MPGPGGVGRVRRLVAAVLLALALPGLASAHGGRTVATGSNAVYDLSVQASDVLRPDGGQAVDLTAYPIRRANGAPDLEAEVSFAIDGSQAIPGRRSGDGIEATIPVSRRGEWRSWTVAATVRGAAGSLSVTGAPGRPRDDPGPPALIPVSALLAVVAVGWAVVVRRRRRDDTGSPAAHAGEPARDP